jgi:EAL domain-containing protein (putative c-di-GMP-specific phosphodiesterase class I)
MQVTEVTENFNPNNIVPFFQPIMDLSNNAVWSYECLARLLTFDQGSFLPTEFLYLLERQQSNPLLTKTVLGLSASYFRDINMAWNINLSLADMTDKETLAFVRSQLVDYPNPQRISIEITAQNALSQSTQFNQFAELCRTLGINIVIDNFEQQTDKLMQLLSMPISAIKVSAQMFEKSNTNPELTAFINQLITQAHEQNIVVIAERIEHQSTLNIVKRLGIKYAQGFYFSQPKATLD